MAKRRAKSKKATKKRAAPEADIESLLRRHAAGEKLTVRDKRRVTRFRKEVLPGLIAEYLQGIPKGEYEAMAGRARQVLDSQAERWGLPFSGETVDLAAVIRAFHDFVGKHGQAIRAAERMKSETKDISKAKFRLYLAKAKREELAYDRDRAVLVPMDVVEEVLVDMAGVLRRLGGWFSKRKLRDAHREHERALESVQRIGRRLLSKPDDRKDGGGGPKRTKKQTGK